MNDNIIIENLEFSEELYQKALKDNIFDEDLFHGVGEDENGNS